MVLAQKRTALYEEHLKLSAKMVPFAGWEMPVSYPTGIINEHIAVRTGCGMFDVSHMGIIDIAGKNALDFILKVATNNASLLTENEGQYAAICNEKGGTVDDIFIFRLEDRFRLVVNASNTDKVLEWLNQHAKNFKNLAITHRTDLGILSVQGPKAKDLLKVKEMPPRNHCRNWGDLLFSHTGYTGEEGFEFFVPVDSMPNVWESFVTLGMIPCGLGARDTLRLEAGLPLYGHELDENTSILEVGYSWAAKLDHDFIGKDILLKQKDNLTRKLVGLKFSDKAIPRQGAEVFQKGEKIGIVTSGTFSPTLKIPIAMAFVKPETAEIGAALDVSIRGNLYPAIVTKKKMV